MFDTDALRLLDAVALAGSFTGAAAKLNYTQSAVSRRIASLEQQAGGPLFERLNRLVELAQPVVVGGETHVHRRVVRPRVSRREVQDGGFHDQAVTGLRRAPAGKAAPGSISRFPGVRLAGFGSFGVA